MMSEGELLALYGFAFMLLLSVSGIIALGWVLYEGWKDRQPRTLAELTQARRARERKKCQRRRQFKTKVKKPNYKTKMHARFYTMMFDNGKGMVFDRGRDPVFHYVVYRAEGTDVREELRMVTNLLNRADRKERENVLWKSDIRTMKKTLKEQQEA